MPAVYAFLDRIDEAEEEEATDFMAALMATFYGTKKELWHKIFAGEDVEDEDIEGDEAGTSQAPKEKPQRKKKSTSPGSSDSETGTDS